LFDIRLQQRRTLLKLLLRRTKHWTSRESAAATRLKMRSGS
jgi:hypothetical protein